MYSVLIKRWVMRLFIDPWKIFSLWYLEKRRRRSFLREHQRLTKQHRCTFGHCEWLGRPHDIETAQFEFNQSELLCGTVSLHCCTKSTHSPKKSDLFMKQVSMNCSDKNIWRSRRRYRGSNVSLTPSHFNSNVNQSMSAYILPVAPLSVSWRTR